MRLLLLLLLFVCATPVAAQPHLGDLSRIDISVEVDTSQSVCDGDPGVHRMCGARTFVLVTMRNPTDSAIVLGGRYDTCALELRITSASGGSRVVCSDAPGPIYVPPRSEVAQQWILHPFSLPTSGRLARYVAEIEILDLPDFSSITSFHASGLPDVMIDVWPHTGMLGNLWPPGWEDTFSRIANRPSVLRRGGFEGSGLRFTYLFVKQEDADQIAEEIRSEGWQAVAARGVASYFHDASARTPAAYRNPPPYTGLSFDQDALASVNASGGGSRGSGMPATRDRMVITEVYDGLGRLIQSHQSFSDERGWWSSRFDYGHLPVGIYRIHMLGVPPDPEREAVLGSERDWNEVVAADVEELRDGSFYDVHWRWRW